MAGPCEGYYASVNLLAPSVLHKHFETWVNEEEFLASSLKCFNTETGQVEALPTLVEECAIWSNCLNCFVKAYAYDNIQVIYTDTLFTEEEFIKFQGMYTESLTDGVRPMLAHRREFFSEEYIYGLIDLSLKTKKPVNGCLKIDFSEFGAECIDILYCSKMMYTVPIPGFFKRVEVDEKEKMILFYV